ncbi:MAG: DUF1109 domain-containing protein [Proteobacteria bacterium]|nr:DUF1109 domain-containing protein [Pseudomonadota bacterium]
MNTDHWIDALARQAEPVATRQPAPLLARALAWGLPGTLALLLLGYGLRPDLGTVLGWPMFWVKLGMPLAVALAGLALVARLGRPGVSGGAAWWGVLLPVLLVWTMAAWQWAQAAPADRPALLWGQTWRGCLVSIGWIALPVFVATLGALRQLAPTRPSLAGAAAGLLAGGAGAAAYALHCPEMTAPFLAVWYVLGMAVPVLLGALLGPRLLRW